MTASGISGTELRARRVAAGMTQRQLAESSGLPQPSISAYESGRIVPSSETRAKLDLVLRVPGMRKLRLVEAEIHAAAKRRDLSNVRVFGSVRHGTAGPDSDVDLLVTPGTKTSIFDLAGFMDEVQEMLGVSVDVVSDRGSGPTLERIRAEAVAL